MKYKAPRKMNPKKMVEMQREWWNMYEVGPYGWYRTDKDAVPIVGDWHRLPEVMGCRLFGLVHEGQVHSFMAVSFRKKKSAAHIYLAYTPLRSRGKGYAKELKRQFFELAKKEGIQLITVDCQTAGGDALFKDGVTMYENKHGRPRKSYSLAQPSPEQVA